MTEPSDQPHDSSRQDPRYPVEDSVRDAVALVTALVHDPDGDLVDVALENALSGTDHTLLAYNLGMISHGLLELISKGTGRSMVDLIQEYASASGIVIEGLTDD